MGSVHFPALNEMELQQLVNRENEEMEILTQDLTREYHEKVAEGELAFRQSLYQLHLNALPQQQAMDPFLFSPLNDMRIKELLRRQNVIAELLTEDLTRTYNERVQELEFAFRQRRHQLHSHAISQHGVIPIQITQQKRSRPERDIANKLHKSKKQKKVNEVLGKKLQKDSSKSVDSKLPEGPGWCALCEVQCTREKDLKKHMLGKKHLSKSKLLKQDSGKANSKQRKYLTKQQQQQDIDIICNLDKRVNQIKEMGVPDKNLQGGCSTSLNSGLPERPGWCALCKVQCSSENNLEEHILGKKHQSKEASQPNPIRSRYSCSKGSK